MTRVPTFGFSAFLGMLFLNERPQRSKIKKRLLPSRSGGKDYHLPFRQAAQRLLTEGKPIEEVISSLQNIRNASQRQSAIDGINRLSEWQVFKTHERLKFGPAIYESPNSVFRVRFDPDFGFDLGGRHTAIQIWNNKASISPPLTLAALTFLKQSYASLRGGPDDWAVLSLRDMVLYRHSEANQRDAELAAMLATKIEKTFANVLSEIANTTNAILDVDLDHPDVSL